ncbi:hypothetical protein BE11_15960 [Sorangium cellulosum]|nr:hypothetical protein BE11_15960 [Sorangium cellulosum]
MDTEDLLVNFYNGAHMVDAVAAWAYVVADRQVVLEHLMSFERAYEQLVALHAAGKLGVGTADFSAENLELVRRINRLVERALDSNEGVRSAREIHSLAERCARALRGSDTSPAG